MSVRADVKPIAVFGAGGFGLEVAMLIEQINAAWPRWRLIGFFDDDPVAGPVVSGYSVLGDTRALNEWPEDLSLALGLGIPRIRKAVVEKITNPRIQYPTLIHPSVIKGHTNYVKLGKGCILCAGTILTTHIDIGDQVVFNLACTVGHETAVGAYSTFMPTCNISGEVVIGQETFWGTGAKVINRVRVGDRAVIGAGAVVIRDIPPGATAVGVPAKIIKQDPSDPLTHSG